MKMGNGKVGRIENRRDEQRRKHSKMDKEATDKLIRSPGEDWRRVGCPKRSSF